MPTYQYVCTACEQPLEAVQSFSDAALTECPHCGGRLRKVYGAVGVVFKGSGFYKNDSRSEKKSSASDAPAAAKTDSSPATPAPAASTPSSTPSTSSTPAAPAGKPA